MATTESTVIETRRLRLVPLTLDEAAALVDGHRPRNARWAVGYPTGNTLIGASLVLAAEQEGRGLGRYGSYQMIRRDDRMVIGDCGFHGPPDAEGAVHVSFEVAEGGRGAPYAVEALEALAAWARAQPAVRRVLGETAVTNLDARHILQSAGFHKLRTADGLVYYEA